MTDLAQRIQRLEDIEAIKKLKARYWFACDRRDADAVKQCFVSDDLLIDFGFIGQFTDIDEFLELFMQMTNKPSHIDLHHGLAPEISIDGDDDASGRWRMQFQLIETETEVAQFMGGYYEDDYRRENGEWKIATTRYHLTFNLMLQKDAVGALKLIEMGAVPGLASEA
ncbi:MAG: nuclear transport factor 2 family protein [Gammaproteobacteria bacterium]|nr:nuclear transport factor 2 family protein [Gammaproteobacteria bacterium]